MVLIPIVPKLIRTWTTLVNIPAQAGLGLDFSNDTLVVVLGDVRNQCGSAIAGVDGVVAVSCGSVIPNTSALGLFQIGQRGTVDAWIYDDPIQPLATYQRLVRPGLVITDRIRVSGGRDIAYTNSAAGGLVDVYVTGYQESI